MRRKWASNLNSEFIRIGSDPTYMLLGPVLSTEKALFKARFSVEDIDVFEINDIGILETLIDDIKRENPQIIASSILKSALNLTGGKAMDDMTVAVINICKN